MKLLRETKLWLAVVVSLVAAQAVASLSLTPGYALTFISDWLSALLIGCLIAAFASNAFAASGRVRLFWSLQAISWALLLINHALWMVFDLVLKRDVPDLFFGDAILFVSGVPALAGLLLQPHLVSSKFRNRLGIVDFLLLLVWWIYLYLFFVIPWQYVLPSVPAYNSSYDVLGIIQDGVMILVIGLLAYQSSGGWRRFYSAFLVAQVLRSLSAFALNKALEHDRYYSGSWYDLPYLSCLVMFVAVALLGRGLSAIRETVEDELAPSWVSTLATIVLLSLPIMAATEILDRSVPAPVARYRTLATLATILVMAYLVFVKQHRLGRELGRANQVLEEASLTDPLTGVRNRRFFYATIEADVGQVLRAYADKHDHRTRDLIFYVIDADDFKLVNDKYGHDAGDRVLIEMARRIGSAIRNSDVLVRWGGEEFLVVSRYTDRAEAETLASRVLSAVAHTPFELEGTPETTRKTCSVGWAAFPWFPDDPAAVRYEDVRHMADRALGEAKQSGKNRAIGVFPAGQPTPVVNDPGLYVSRIPVEKLCTIGPAIS